jgi:hypothetical protein
LTKHISDETAKLHVSLEDAEKLIAENVKLLDSNSMGICVASVNAQVKSMHKVSPKPTMVKTKMKVTSFKSKLGKIMHKLYDLEPGNAPEKPLNVDLGVDLYQMENF